MLEKLQLAQEENYKDPANIQSKHQKHQAFEAELAANADRIQSVLAMGQNLIDRKKCSGSEEAVQNRLESIAQQWEKTSGVRAAAGLLYHNIKLSKSQEESRRR